MEYYKTNAIYEHIIAKRLAQFKFVVGNAWQLVYGDQNCIPKVLIFARGVSTENLQTPLVDKEKSMFGLLQLIGSKKLKLPTYLLNFDINANTISNITISQDALNYAEISLVKLSELMQTLGLPVSNTQTAKYLNDRVSSAYHSWQRKSLGAGLTVSDIDLWKLTSQGPKVIYELKRSYYELDRWKPFTDDYRNFMLLSNLCNSAGIEFKIIYNVRIKSPFEDRIDKLKIFKVDFSKTPPIVEEGIISLSEFENL